MTGKVVPLEFPESGAVADPLADEIDRLTGRIGSMVRSARGSRGISRRELSEVSGVSQRYLAQIEAGEGNLSVAMLVRLGAALNIPATAFFAAEAMEAKPVRFALVGLRGAGKSTVGPMLAPDQGLTMDVDQAFCDETLAFIARLRERFPMYQDLVQANVNSGFF